MRTLVAVGVHALMALNNDEWQLDGGKQAPTKRGRTAGYSGWLIQADQVRGKALWLMQPLRCQMLRC